jgi:hypothetical protein
MLAFRWPIRSSPRYSSWIVSSVPAKILVVADRDARLSVADSFVAEMLVVEGQ